MFAGHIGAALAIGRAERRVNVGMFIAAALLLDVLLWAFVLLGWEAVSIPPEFASTHQPEYSFGWSHGLVSAIAWSIVAGAIGSLLHRRDGARRVRLGAWIAAAVFSHWMLDALVHRPELPVAGAGSTRIGLGLWQWMPAALVVESAIVLVGAWLFLHRSPLPRGRSIGLAVLTGVVLVFTIFGMTIAPPPPSPAVMAASSLVTLVVVISVALWLGRGE